MSRNQKERVHQRLVTLRKEIEAANGDMTQAQLTELTMIEKELLRLKSESFIGGRLMK